MKKLISISLIICCSIVYGQPKVTLELADSIYTLSKTYFRTNTDSALFYGKIAQNHYAQLNNLSKEAESLNLLGVVYCYILSEYDTAETYLNKAINKAKKANDSLTLCKAYGSLAEVEKRRGNYGKCADLAFKSLALAESINGIDSNILIGKYLDAGNVMLLSHQPKKSLSYLKAGLQLAKKLNNRASQGNALNSVANAYDELEQLDSAIYYSNQNIELRRQINDNNGLIFGLITTSEIHIRNKDFLTAKQLLNEALYLSEKYADDYTASNLLNHLGVVYMELKEYKNAILNFEKSAAISKKIASTEAYYITLSQLAKAYYLTNNYKKAYEYYQKYQEHKNYLITEDYNKQLSESETKYQTEKKEAENKQLKVENELKAEELAAKQAQQKTLIISFVALLLFILALAFYINYKRKIKAHKQLQQEEKLRFKAVIEAEEKERIRIAKELHDGLGQLLSTAKLNVASLEGNVDKEDEFLVKNASDLIDNAVSEVRSISHNMMPIALTQLGLISAVKELIGKMNDSGLLNVQFESNIENRLNSSIEIAIYRVVQEILNNIIKHAQAKEIKIQLKIENQRLKLQISDDGVGFNTNEIDKSKGIGWKSVFSRIAMLNGNIDVNSSQEKGTNLLVSIPVNE